MEFLLYLTAEGRDIYNLISKRFSVVENAPICRSRDIYGWFDAKQKLMIVCTEHIKKSSDIKYNINETIYHESVHAAQSCKSGDGYMEPFGISSSHMPLSERRKQDLKKVISSVGPIVKKIEHEAFWMEDKPDKVRYVVRKYCF